MNPSLNKIFLVAGLLLLFSGSLVAQDTNPGPKIYFQFASADFPYEAVGRAFDEKVEPEYHPQVHAVYINQVSGFEEKSTEEDFLNSAPQELKQLYQALPQFLDTLISISEDKARYDVVLIDDRKGLKNGDKTYFSLYPGSEPDKYYVLPQGTIQPIWKNSDKKLITLYVGMTAIQKNLTRLNQAMQRAHPGKNFSVDSDFYLIPALQAAFMAQMRWEDERDEWYYQQFYPFFDPRSPGFQEELWDLEEDALLRGLSTWHAISTIDSWKKDGELRIAEYVDLFLRDSLTKFLLADNSVLQGFNPQPEEKLVTVSNRKFWVFDRRQLPVEWFQHSENVIAALLLQLETEAHLNKFGPHFRTIMQDYLKLIWKENDQQSLAHALCFISNELTAFLNSEAAWHASRNDIEVMNPAIPFAFWDVLTLFRFSDEEFSTFFEDVQDDMKPAILAPYISKRQQIKREILGDLRRVEQKSLQSAWFITFVTASQIVPKVMSNGTGR